MWDIEVDIAVIGAGIGGLVNAIATVDAGGEVLVADAATPACRSDAAPGALRERVGAKRNWLSRDTVDVETNAFLAAISEGLSESDVVRDMPVPRRVARNLSRDEAFGRVETFVGSRLTAWAAQCVTSPYGLLNTSMWDCQSITMRSDDGESIEVQSIGAMEVTAGFDENALHRWVSAEALERDIEVRAANTLERIVFEEGVIVGVVLATSDGPCAVRTRAGVTLAPGDHAPVVDDGAAWAAGSRLQVCVVGRTASRFGRVELLATEPAAPPRPICTGSRRQLRNGLHDARQPSLEGWRCGKVHGYPTFGQ
ncbi:hypothetical protein [Mycolicibacterium hodleri]|uniref:FAD-dependent oxidoreductase 2 FAD binding domain-containing protein n=1 Tax=Mycolicibacterium hodleri TaxID=49897 RepID=A0A502EK73_9MYCO|nr:hypothetical protein [Mycolicibacterium hodleri]TPG36731.1 hypothetical protein EAH80_02010 [Mycolicibacterium hodleri]